MGKNVIIVIMGVFMMIQNYIIYLIEEELSEQTIKKYVCDTMKLLDFLDNKQINKINLLEFKQSLLKKYALTSINSIIAGVNSFLKFLNLSNLKIKPLKIQRKIFLEKEKEITMQDYKKIIKIANKKDYRLSLIIQTITTTGIRISELEYITVSSINNKKAIVSNKGKVRVVLLPDELCKELKKYSFNNGIKKGHIFVTRNGKPLNRSNIWRMMKNLCEQAGVSKEKVFPHNLRHLFAKTYYKIEKDICKLADILGHSSVETTRIYITESGEKHLKQLNKLYKIFTT